VAIRFVAFYLVVAFMQFLAFCIFADKFDVLQFRADPIRQSMEARVLRKLQSFSGQVFVA